MKMETAYQKALEISLNSETPDAVVFRTEFYEYGAISLDLYDGPEINIVAIFENGLMLE